MTPTRVDTLKRIAAHEANHGRGILVVELSAETGVKLSSCKSRLRALVRSGLARPAHVAGSANQCSYLLTLKGRAALAPDGEANRAPELLTPTELDTLIRVAAYERAYGRAILRQELQRELGLGKPAIHSRFYALLRLGLIEAYQVGRNYCSYPLTEAGWSEIYTRLGCERRAA